MSPLFSSLFKTLHAIFSVRVPHVLTLVALVLSLVSAPSFSDEVLEHHATGISPEVQAELSNEALHTRLIVTAIKYDTFNQRCRGVSAAYNTSKVNRLFLRKFGITLNDYMMNYMSKDANDPRDVKQKIVNKVNQTIAKMGGCQPARKKGLEQSYKDDYRNLYHKVEKSTWFPSVNND
ncbi:hypothetical protein [Hydrogenovibrio kuenenii]|uniref:hypothetical protein n=1 Tax=Hydrogenovibrio kuenenii TaxID=63658 RepID=UPI000467BE35|nr:hypothetical protein [Hydrogenovibrio kuenenii]